MNFHKTIGFLATLLLTLGLGVPDSFAQDVEVNLSLQRTYVRESGSVAVTVTLATAPGAGTTVSIPVNVESTADYVHTIDGVDDGADPPVLTPDATSVTVEISGTSTRGTATVNIVDDDTFRDTGMLNVSLGTLPGGYTEGDNTSRSAEIRDNDDATGGDLKLTVSPPSFSAGATADQTVTVTVELAAVPTNTVTVTTAAVLKVSGADDAPLTLANIEIDPTAAVAADRKRGTAVLTLTSGEAAAVGIVEVMVSATNYNKTERNIPIILRDADDVEGFRVTIAPANGAWLGFNKNKVKVTVTRLDNTLSFPWETFNSIAVSLRDTAGVIVGGADPGAHDFMTVTASDFANEDGTIVFAKAVADNDPAAPNPVLGNSKITYSVADDKLIFEIELDELTTANVASVLGTLTGEVAGTGAVDPAVASDDRHPQAGNTAKGQRMGVYASAVFTVGTNTYRLNSNDTKKSVFSNPASLTSLAAADRVVGDGKLFKIDLIKPTNPTGTTINVTLNNNKAPVVQATEARIGDEIKVAVGIGARTRFIRDGGMQIQIQTVGNTDASGNAKAATLKTANFTQAQISAAAGDSLRTSLKLTKGLIKTPATADGHSPDGVEIKKNAKFEPDYVELRARVRTKDQASNFSSATQQDFYGDTRAPGISVLYPADGGRFTGLHIDSPQGFDEHLNPLKIRVDEEIDSLYVYADGTRTADDVTAENFIEKAAILLWSDETRDQELSDIVDRAGATTVGDTITYRTTGLKYKKSNNDLAATGQGGTKVDLVVVAVDKVGNSNEVTLKGVFHDEKPPTITDWFPKRSLLEDDDYQINNATRHPVITLKEAVDSLSVTYDPSSGANIVEVREDLAKDDHQVIISDPFVHDRTYTLTIFARDLAGNAFETNSDDAADLRFNQNFDNPTANAFTVKNVSPAESDSVVAGQAFYLEIQAIDKAGDTKRDALTYKNDMAAEVRISAWAGGAAVESVVFHGGGVTDNNDGSAMLDADGWKLGKRRVYAKSEKAVDLLKILVEHRTAGAGGTTVAAFDGSIDSLYVDAADFMGFEITAWEDGAEVQEVWGEFNLRVVPVDKFGNASVKSYKTTPTKGKNDLSKAADVTASTDSLGVLDTRVKENGHNYKNGFDVNLRSLPNIDLPPFEWTIDLDGVTFPVTAPSRPGPLYVQVRVDNTSLNSADTRSHDTKDDETFTISAPLMPVLSLWVPGSTMDESGNDVEIPADAGEITVTVRIEERDDDDNPKGLPAGTMVTFTKNGTAMDPVAVDEDGYAKLPVTMSAAGSVTVSAMAGQYSADELTITFVEAPDEPVRLSFNTEPDGSGDPVYLIDLLDNMTDLADYGLFRAAWGKMKGDDINGDGTADDTDVQIFLQADINEDGMVDLADYEKFLMSWGKTANPGPVPASKPIVLLPGINENAEFSLSLGSERVVAGELVAVDVSLANIEALVAYGFTLNYDTDKFEFVSVAPADEDLLTSTGGESMLFHNMLADGQVEVVNGVFNGTAVSGGGDIVRFVFRVLREFEDNARFEIADGLVFDPTNLSNPAVVAGVLELQSTPREFALHQNFPNPFNPDTTINYELAESADVTLQIYNVLGQVVRTLVASEAQNAGRYQIRWNGMDDRGVPVSSGIYFYQISADEKFSDVRKLMLLK